MNCGSNCSLLLLYMQSFDEKEGRREFEGKKVEIGAHDFELTEFQRSVVE